MDASGPGVEGATAHADASGAGPSALPSAGVAPGPTLAVASGLPSSTAGPHTAALLSFDPAAGGGEGPLAAAAGPPTLLPALGASSGGHGGAAAPLPAAVSGVLDAGERAQRPGGRWTPTLRSLPVPAPGGGAHRPTITLAVATNGPRPLGGAPAQALCGHPAEGPSTPKVDAMMGCGALGSRDQALPLGRGGGGSSADEERVDLRAALAAVQSLLAGSASLHVAPVSRTPWMRLPLTRPDSARGARGAAARAQPTASPHVQAATSVPLPALPRLIPTAEGGAPPSRSEGGVPRHLPSAATGAGTDAPPAAYTPPTALDPPDSASPRGFAGPSDTDALLREGAGSDSGAPLFVPPGAIAALPGPSPRRAPA